MCRVCASVLDNRAISKIHEMADDSAYSLHVGIATSPQMSNKEQIITGSESLVL